METAIRWSGSSTLSEQRFLIADVNGRSFKRCMINNYDGTNIHHQVLSTYSKVPPFRAFDWAPHEETLAAVGQWSGEITILRIDDSEANFPLPAKHQRLCNAIAFSRTGLLAAGLERVRNDFCLNIWDVNQRLQAVMSPGGRSSKGFVEPYRKFASSEAISSIKFYSAQPEVLVAGIKGRGIRIYDLRENTGSPSLHFQTSCVHNIAIDPLDENYFACAGVPKDTTIQIWDLRHGSPYTAASLGSGSDISSPAGGPVLEYKEVFSTANVSTKVPVDPTGVMISSIWSLRYCKGKSGCLGALASNGELKVFETKHEYSLSINHHESRSHPDYDVPSKNDGSILTKRIHHVELAWDDKRKGRPEKERIVAFDFTNLAGSKGTPCAIVLRGDQSVGVVELNGAASALTVSPFGNVVVSNKNSLTSTSASTPELRFLKNTIRRLKPSNKGGKSRSSISIRDQNGNSKAREPTNFANTDGRATVARKPQSSRESHEQLLETRTPNAKFRIEEVLALFAIARRRCVEGYLFDCEKNIEILQDDRWLQRLWIWIRRAKSSAEDNGMSTETLDLSFFGVASIWNNDLVHNKHSKPTYSKDVADAVETLCDKLDLPEFRMVESAAPNHRRLCLYTCGLGLPYEKLEATVKDFVRQGQNTKAAALAIIHDQAKLAFQALRSGNASQAQRELSLALAGYNKGVIDDTWEETVRDIKSDLDDPYARAILALVSYGDWHDVLAETSLPLRDRVGIALMYLDDDELTHYITDNAAECIQEGDIEGIVLTGLTEQAVPLFENFIRKFSDLQTAILAMSFTCPNYFTDPRVDLWRQTYRSQLNSWRMFIPRVHFDVQSTKLSVSLRGKAEIQPPSRQVSIRCNNCDQALHRKSSRDLLPSSYDSSGTHQGSIFGDAKSGTVCPKCGRHMPSCVICMQWLGMPDPHSRGAVEEVKREVEAEKDGIAEIDPLEKFMTVCRRCWHMSHGAHSREWFEGRFNERTQEWTGGHDKCPVPGCDCTCRAIDVGVTPARKRNIDLNVSENWW
ncbi:MAG: hypothetical protein ASARMPREDX12_003146 [Alectoria sarmentosa]|nr:MAG: hypothetical protein ASARMPREDX12_003146 [Alectoria sarmentosa]